jgi:ubiquinone/menaquinone biosynthesis C-methylase UbiE
MLDYARHRLTSLSFIPVNLLEGDCAHTPFQSGAFDVIVCLGVFSYVEDKQGMLREIQRILNPRRHSHS